MIIHPCGATHSSTSSRISPAPAANFSFTTTGFERAPTPTLRWPRRRAALPRGSRASAFERAMRSCSSAKTGPNGSSPSGAASCRGWSSCRSTIDRQPTSWRESAGSSEQSWCWLDRRCRTLPIRPADPSGGFTTSNGREERLRPSQSGETMLPRSSSRRARPPIPRAWSSPTRMSSPTSCRSNARW